MGLPKKGPGRPKGPARRRVQVTLSLETWAIVERIAEITGQHKAALLAEIFEAALPSFETTIKALELAKQQPREAQRLVTNYAAQQVLELQQAHLALDATITDHMAKKPRRRRARAP